MPVARQPGGGWACQSMSGGLQGGAEGEVPWLIHIHHPNWVLPSVQQCLQRGQPANQSINRTYCSLLVTVGACTDDTYGDKRIRMVMSPLCKFYKCGHQTRPRKPMLKQDLPSKGPSFPPAPCITCLLPCMSSLTKRELAIRTWASMMGFLCPPYHPNWVATQETIQVQTKRDTRQTAASWGRGCTPAANTKRFASRNTPAPVP